MAYAIDSYPNQEELERQQQQLMAAPAGGATAPAGGTTAGQPAQGAQANNGAVEPFVGFSQYLEANRDASTARGTALAGSLGQQGAGAQSALTGLQSSFADKMKAGFPGYPNWQGRAPTADELKTFIGSSYTGPNGLGDVTGYDDAYQKALQAQSGVDATKSPYGLQATLGTEGQRGALDAALVGTTSGDKFAALQQKYGGLLKSYDDADAAAAGKANDARSGLARDQDFYRGVLDRMNQPPPAPPAHAPMQRTGKGGGAPGPGGFPRGSGGQPRRSGGRGLEASSPAPAQGTGLFSNFDPFAQLRRKRVL